MIREGKVGLFALFGLVVFSGLVVWLRGGFGANSYEIIVEFPDVNGITAGSPVTYRGFNIGRVKEINPGSNGIDVTLEISAPDLSIPRNVEITTNRYGLIGETSVDIIPIESVPAIASSMRPMDSDCNSETIICAGDRVSGEVGLQLIPALVRLAELYGDEEFYNNLNNAAIGLSKASVEIVKLSKELTLLSGTVREEITGLSANINSVSQAATKTGDQVTKLASNFDNLLTENRSNITTTLTTLNDVSRDIQALVINLEAITAKVNSSLETADTEQIIEDLEVLTANLREVSENLNSPTNLLVLQETLDSARATFANAKKITADLDELTGDPMFRQNLRNLVNGLSNLVSSTEELDTLIASGKISFGVFNAPPSDLIFSQLPPSTFEQQFDFWE